MKWSLRVARVSGIDIRIHASFFLILLLGAVQWGTPHGLAGAAFGILLMATLFVCVTLHELGHSVVAQRFGIPVREIVLLPIGGLALLEREPEKPIQELLVAAAGPLVNVAIAAGLYIVGSTSGYLGSRSVAFAVVTTGAAPSLATALVWLLAANVSLTVFNLIPAFPLDGGRIFRAMLAMLVGSAWATKIAAATGQGLAVALGLFGVVTGNLVLALVATFVFFGASQQSGPDLAAPVLRAWRARDLAKRQATTLSPSDRLADVAAYTLTGYQSDFAVLLGSRFLGVIAREDVLRAVSAGLAYTYVTGLMQRDVNSVDADVTLEGVRRTMAEKRVRLVAVYESGAYLGLISIEDIARAAALLKSVDRSALQPDAAPLGKAS